MFPKVFVLDLLEPYFLKIILKRMVSSTLVLNQQPGIFWAMDLLLMAETLHQFIGNLSHYF